MSTMAIPGQMLASTSTHSAGPGTHVYSSNIYASITGSTVTVPASHQSDKPTISIPRRPARTHPISATAASTRRSSSSSTAHLSGLTNTVIPNVGSTVLCRITRVQQRLATASILVVDPSPTSAVVPYTSTTNDELQFQALLRLEDVRAFEKDRVVLNECFRVGDVVRAVVISLGDERNYYISTAGDENGVLVARGDGGSMMVPVSWKEMKDLVTGKAEARKVAKPV